MNAALLKALLAAGVGMAPSQEQAGGQEPPPEAAAQALQALSREAMCVGRTDGTLLQANPAARYLLAPGGQPASGQRLQDCVHRDDVAAVTAALAQLADGQGLVTFRTRQRDNALRAVEWRATPVEGDCFCAVGQELTHGYALADSERLFRMTHEILTVVTLEGGFIRVNPAFQASLGYSEAELSDRVAYDLLHPEDAPRVREAVMRLADGGGPEELETRWYARDGSLRWFRSHNVLDAAQGLIYSAAQDVTAEHAAHEALEASEARYRQLLDALEYGVLIHRDRKALYVNPAFARLHGCATPEELLAEADSIDAWLPEDEAERLRSYGRARLTGGEAPKSYEYRGLCKDGSTIWLRNTVRLIEWEGSTAFLEIHHDVTEQREAEQALREQRELLRTVFDTVPHRLFLKDAAGTYLMVNRAQAAYYGTTVEAMEGILTEELPLPSEMLERIRAEDEAIIASEEGVEHARLCVQDPHGGQRWMREIKLPVRNAGGGTYGLVGVAEDITQYTQTEQALQEQRELLRTVLDSIPHRTLLKDTDGRFLMVNRAQAEFFGHTPESMVGLHTRDLPLPPEEVAAIEEEDRRTLQEGTALDLPEVEAVDGDGNRRWLHVIKLPVRDGQGRITSLVSIAEDVSAQRQARQDLSDQQALLRTVFDGVPQRMYIKDAGLRFLMVNRAQADFFGMAPEELVGQRTRDLPLPPGLSESIEAEDRRVIEQGETVDLAEVAMPDVQGKQRWLHVCKLPVRDAAGRVTGLIGIAEDITERYEAAQQLRESQRLLQTIFDTIPFPLHVKDADGRFLLVNRAFGAMNFTEPETLLGRRTGEYGEIRPEAARRYLALDEAVRATGRTQEDPDLLHERHHGPTLRMRVIKSPLLDESGAFAGTVGIAVDITEQKHAEESLRASQRLLQTIFDTIPHPLTVKDAEGRYVMVNSAFSERLHRGTEELHGRLPGDLNEIDTPAARLFHEMDQEVLRTGRMLHRSDVRSGAPGKPQSLLEVYKSPLRGPAGRIEGVVTLNVDVTGLRQAEQELRASQNLLQAVFENLPHPLHVKDAAGHYLMVNSAFAHLTGREPNDFLGGRVGELGELAPALADTFRAMDHEVLSEGAVVRRDDVVLPGHDGSDRWLHVIKAPLRDDQGAVTGLLGLSIDDTERRRAEQEVRAGQRLLRTVFDSIPHPVHVKDAACRYVMVNEAFCELRGLTADAIIGRHNEELPGLPAEAVQQAEEADQTVLREGRTLQLPELRSTRADDGATVWLHVIKSPLRDDAGRVTGVVSVNVDITRQRQAQAVVRESAHKLRTIVEGSIQGIMVHKEGTLTFANRALAALFGYESPEALMGELSAFDMPAPHERERVRGYGQARLQGGTAPERFQVECVRRDGSPVWVEALSTLVNWEGETAVLTTLQDITERRRAEEELHASQRLLQTVFDTIPHMLFVKDAEGRYLMINRAYAEAYGLEMDDIVGRRIGEVPHMPADNPALVQAEDEQVLARGEPLLNHQTRYTFPGGVVRDFLVSKKPLHDEQGRPVGLAGVAQDITARVEAERGLQHSEERFRDYAEAASDWFWEMDADLRFTWFSGRARQVLGMDPQRNVGLRRDEIGVTPEDEYAWQRHLEDLEAHRPFRDLRYALRIDEGRLRYISVSGRPVFDEAGAFLGYRGTGRDVTEETLARKEAARAYRRLEDAIESLPAMFSMWDEAGHLILWNSRALEYYPVLQDCLYRGMHVREMLARCATMIDTGGDPEHYVEARLRELGRGHVRREIRLSDGRWLQALDRATSEGGVVSLRFDITEMKRREAELNHAQKMEAVGQLTGGLAHDFNNLLTVILGNLELLRTLTEDDEGPPDVLDSAISAAERGSTLTQRLLTFSRRQSLEPERADLAELVHGLLDLVQRTMGEAITVRTELAPRLEPLLVDPGQLENALLNLAINARDAMPEGGTLSLVAHNEDVREDDPTPALGLPAGRYVHLAVSDSGEGIPEELRERVFDPFFTTKGVGRGSGLGLSMLYGFVTQSGGAVHLESQVGEGTTVHIYLPAFTGAGPPASAAPPTSEPHGNGEVVLVVEDDAGIRSLAVRFLEQLGYTPIAAERGSEALERVAGLERLDALFTDIVLPGGMNGIKLAERLRAERPGLSVLLATGYTDGELLADSQQEPNTLLLIKPYRRADVADRLYSLLYGPSA